MNQQPCMVITNIWFILLQADKLTERAGLGSEPVNNEPAGAAPATYADGIIYLLY